MYEIDMPMRFLILPPFKTNEFDEFLTFYYQKQIENFENKIPQKIFVRPHVQNHSKKATSDAQNWFFNIFHIFQKMLFFFFLMLKHDALDLLRCLSVFIFLYFFWFLRFFTHFSFWSKTLNTHQIRWFWRVGVSKNAWAYRFHVYKWSNHHISLYFWTHKLQLIMPPGGNNSCFFVFSWCKTENPCFFRFSLQRWGLSHCFRLEIWCRFR